MDVRFINPFIHGICHTFETMCSLKVHVGEPSLKTDGRPYSDVSGIIGFSGAAAGSVVLHFPFDTASKIATAFAGIEITPQHPDFGDAIGELANMIAGCAKSQFEGLRVDVSLPNVVIGRNHNVSPLKDTQRLILPCQTEVGQFHVEVGMVISKSPAFIHHSAAVGADS